MSSSVATKRKLTGSTDGLPILVRPILTAALTVPTAPTTALSGTAGICTDGAHTCAITFYTEYGETTIGASGTARTTATANNGQINLTGIPCDPMGLAVGRKVYMSKAGTTTPLYFVGNITDNVTTTFAVNVPDTSLSWASPAANTAYSSKLQAPTVPTTALVTTAAGNCTNGTHVVACTFITPNGETAAGVISTPALTVDGTHNKILVTAVPVDPTGQATGRNIYMSKQGTTWPLYLVSNGGPTIADNITQTYTIDVADASLGAGNYVASPANTALATLLHTAVAGQTVGTFDENWLWAYNSHSADVVLTLEIGTPASAPLLPQYTPPNIVKQTIPLQKGVFLAIPGFILQNANVIRACASVANVISIHSFANAIVDGA
jgi:hypothetical protein